MPNVSSSNWYAGRTIAVTTVNFWPGYNGAQSDPPWIRKLLFDRAAWTGALGTIRIPSLYQLSDALAWQASGDLWTVGTLASTSIFSAVTFDIDSHAWHGTTSWVLRVASSAILTLYGLPGNYGMCYLEYYQAGDYSGTIILKQVIPVTVSLTNPLVVDGVYDEPGGLWTIRHGTPPTEAELTVDDVLIGDAVTEATIAPNVNQTYTYQWDDEDERKVRIVAGVNNRPMKHQIAGPQRKGDTIWRP